jgi:hypothetical protein
VEEIATARALQLRCPARLAKERGFDVIRRIYSRDLVYCDPGSDITGEVLARINREHAGRKK